MLPQISRISCRFVHCEAVFQTKYSCQLKVKVFANPNFGLATPLLMWPADEMFADPVLGRRPSNIFNQYR